MENNLEVPQKVKNRTTIWSSSSTSRYVSKENENTNWKIYVHPRVHCSISYNSQDMQQFKCPSMNEFIKELSLTHTQEYYLATKEEILPLVTPWMDLEGIMLSEISQTVKNKHHIISTVYRNLKKQKNWTHRYREQIGGC